MILEGLGMSIVELMVCTQFTVNTITVGSGTFNPALAPNVIEPAELPNTFVSLSGHHNRPSAVPPMLLAIPLFHRFHQTKSNYQTYANVEHHSKSSIPGSRPV